MLRRSNASAAFKYFVMTLRKAIKEFLVLANGNQLENTARSFGRKAEGLAGFILPTD